METKDVADNLVFNVSTNGPDVTSVAVSYLLCIFGGSLSVLIMSGNLLVIISIIYFKQLHTPTNYLMLSLAVTDLLVGIFVLPFSIILFVSSHWSNQDLLCILRSGLDMLVCATSIMTLCFISVDRYYAVCRPLRYRSIINIRAVVIMILVSWSVSALIAGFFTFWTPTKGQLKGKCVLFQNKTQSSTIISVVSIFCIPAIIMINVYLKIWMVARRQARSIHNITKSTASVSKMEKKATKTLAVVMGVFLMSWMPFFMSYTFQPFSNYTIPVHLIQTFKWFGWSNSMFNPFLYAFFYSWFRSAIRMILTGKIFHGDCSNSKLL